MTNSSWAAFVRWSPFKICQNTRNYPTMISSIMLWLWLCKLLSDLALFHLEWEPYEWPRKVRSRAHSRGRPSEWGPGLLCTDPWAPPPSRWQRRSARVRDIVLTSIDPEDAPWPGQWVQKPTPENRLPQRFSPPKTNKQKQLLNSFKCVYIPGNKIGQCGWCNIKYTTAESLY